MQIKQPIFILGAHKSGTSLLRNLLDGQPDLFCVPFEAHLFMLLGYWIECDYRRNLPEKVDFNKKAIEFVKASNAAVDDIGDSFLRGSLDESIFEKEIYNTSIESDADRFFQAVALSLNSDLTEKRLVEKSVENAEFAMELKQLYPDAKFIHIIRNPYSNWVSLRKYKCIEFGYPLVHRMVATFRNSYYYLLKNKRLLASDYLVIKYEDLLTNTEKELEKICKHIDISFSENMLIPTHIGNNWQGNSTSGEKLQGVSAERLNKWESEISKFEVGLINKNFKHILEMFNYDIENYNNNWSSVKGEPIFRKILNRLYQYYY